MRPRVSSCMLVSSLLLWGAGVSWAAEQAPVAGVARSATEYRRVTFNELIANELKNPIHISFEIPSVYVGLLVDTLASFISFREPGDIQVWNHFVGSARAE